MLYEKVKLEDGTLVKFCTPCWDTELDSEITHEELAHLKRIAQCAREELARAKVGSPVWQALRFVLASPTEKVQEEPTWESKPHK